MSGGQGGGDVPVAALDLLVKLARGPLGVTGEDAHALEETFDRLGLGLQVHVDKAISQSGELGVVLNDGAGGRHADGNSSLGAQGSADIKSLRLCHVGEPIGQNGVDGQFGAAVEDDAEGGGRGDVDKQNDGAGEVIREHAWGGDQQHSGRWCFALERGE